MENASKALIIAGSILVSIVIITLGVMIVNNVTGLVQSQSDMSGQEVEAFNSKFQSYEGTQKGANARALYNLIKNHNNINTDDPTLQVTLTTNSSDAPATQAASDTAATMAANTIKAGKTYNVTFSVDPNSGRITVCNIAEK